MELSQLDKLVCQFENQTLAKNNWHHDEHVAVAFHYLEHLPYEQALKRIRVGIQLLNKAHGVEQRIESGYHETLTVFFVGLLHNTLAELETNLTKDQRLNLSLEQFRSFNTIVSDYYSKELISSWKARTSWIAPDLRELLVKNAK